MTDRDRQYISRSPCHICRVKNCRKLNCPIFYEWFLKAWAVTTGLLRARTEELDGETKRDDRPSTQGVLHNSNT